MKIGKKYKVVDNSLCFFEIGDTVVLVKIGTIFGGDEEKSGHFVLEEDYSSDYVFEVLSGDQILLYEHVEEVTE